MDDFPLTRQLQEYLKSEDPLLDIEPFNAAQFTALPIAISWSAIGKEFAKAALGKVAGEVLGAFFGASDADKVVNAIVYRMRRIVGEEIRREALEIAAKRLRKVENLYLDYQEIGDTEIADEIRVEIEDAVQDYQRFGWSAHHAYMVAAGMQFAILKDMYGDSQESRNRIADRARLAIEHVEPFEADWRRWHNNRYAVREVTVGYQMDDLRIRHPIIRYGVTRDGDAVGGLTKKRNKARNGMVGLRDHDWVTATKPKEVDPSNEIIAEWQKLVAQAG